MKSLAIEREFGSGGREIGMRVAELAGRPYYDGELLIKACLLYTSKDNTQIYKTGEMNDPTLTERLYASGAKFTRNIEKGMSPLLSFFLTFIPVSYTHLPLNIPS